MTSHARRLRIPESWNDRTLLEDEPFLSTFLARITSDATPRRRGKQDEMDKAVASDILRSSKESAQAWLNMAFAASAKENPKIRKMKVKVTSVTAEIMVQIFWLLYRDQDDGALVVLTKERKSRGFDWDPPISPKMEEDTVDSVLEPLQTITRSLSVDIAMAAQPEREDVTSDMDLSPAYSPSTFIFDSEEEKEDIPLVESPAFPDAPIISEVEAVLPIQPTSIEHPPTEETTVPFIRKRVLSKEDGPADILERRRSPPPHERNSLPPSSPVLDFRLRSAAIFPDSTEPPAMPGLPTSISSVAQPQRQKSTSQPSKKKPRRVNTEALSDADVDGQVQPGGLPNLRRSSRSVSAMPATLRKVSVQPAGRSSLSTHPCGVDSTTTQPARVTKNTKTKTKVQANSNAASAQQGSAVQAPAGSQLSSVIHITSSKIQPAHDVNSTSQVATRNEVARLLKGLPPATGKARKARKLGTFKVPRSPKTITVLPSRPEKRRRTSAGEEIHVTAREHSQVVLESPTHELNVAIQQAPIAQTIFDKPAAQMDVDFHSFQELPQHPMSLISTAASSSTDVSTSFNASRGTAKHLPGLPEPLSKQQRHEARPATASAFDEAYLARATVLASMPATSMATRTFDAIKGLHFRKTSSDVKTKVEQVALAIPGPESPRMGASSSRPNIPSALGKRERAPDDVIHDQHQLKKAQSTSRTKPSLLKPRPKTYKARKNGVNTSTTTKKASSRKLTLVDKVLGDAAANAIEMLNHVSNPLPNWAEGALDSADMPDMIDEEARANPDNEVDSRPILDKMPPIWSTSRQEVCESLDWFRSYHGGVYFSNNIVKGYLLAGFPSTRDIFAHDGRIIISHGGGGHESLHSRDGRLVPQAAADQLDNDKSVRALLNNHSQNRPVVLIVDDRYKLFPYNLTAKGCAYAVLGFFCITNVWAEYHPLPNASGGAVRYKFCFQWCQSQGDPWWLKSTTKASGSSVETMTSPLSTVNPETVKAVALQVPQSTEANITPFVHKIPIKIEAPSLLKRNSGTLVKCEQCKIQTPQVYQQGWMCLSAKCQAFWKMKDGSCPPLQLDYAPSFLELAPPDGFPQSLPPICPATPQESGSDEITTSFAFTKGWHCTRCGRLSSRYVWAFWECANCHHKISATGRGRNPKEFWSQIDQCTTHIMGANSGIIKSHSATYDVQGSRGEYVKYILPYSRGVIHLIRGNVRANREADAIFEQYQKEAGTAEKLVFRRFPMRAHKCRGSLLTNYFSQNSGEPYQYVGGTDNTVPFSDTAEAVNNALELIRTRAEAALNRKPDFNEILSAAYMEQQKMAFHSDSERGLGPVVASLSLGSAAHMHFRRHKSKENALSLVLRHGDVVVMEGAEVQECYQHTVIPFNFRIAATARWIGGDNASTYR